MVNYAMPCLTYFDQITRLRKTAFEIDEQILFALSPKRNKSQITSIKQEKMLLKIQ